MKTSLLSHTAAALRQKLLQHKMTAALGRSKAITQSPTPIMDQIAAEAKLRGVSCDDLVAEWVSGKVQIPSIDLLMKPATAKHGPTIQATASPKNPMPKPTPPAKPQPQTAWGTYNKLQSIDPIKASVFLSLNRSAILASKPADVTIQF